jgi:Domain of unknown function (DUF4129)
MKRGERASGIEVVEDAVHLLRRTPFETWLCHWAGAVPFALALLRFWNDVLNPRTPDLRCAADALLLALLLVWMNCWRAVFAGRLRRQLGGTGNPEWNGARIWNLVAAQSFLGATKPVAAVLAMVAIFPLSATIAFYREAAVLSGYEGLPPRELMTKARRLAGLQIGQGWTILSIVAVLYLLVAINVALTLGIAPQLVRMLTGYESSFSRSGMYWVENPLFVMLALAVTWMAVDPVIQAVYCMRCFRGESLKTGEDLRAALRRIRMAPAMLLLAVDPAALERSIRHVMRAPEYDWRNPPPTSVARPSWFASLAERFFNGLRLIFHTLGDWLNRLFKWLFRHDVPEPQAGALPKTGLHWSLYVLIAAVVLVAAWIVWRKLRARRAKPEAAPDGGATMVRLDQEDLSADRLPEESWYELGEQSLQEGNPRFALRAFYLGNLAWLGRREFLAISAGKTNHEYELELRRKARAFAEARELFGRNVAAFEKAWYGLHEVGAEDVDEFRRRIEGMKEEMAA